MSYRSSVRRVWDPHVVWIVAAVGLWKSCIESGLAKDRRIIVVMYGCSHRRQRILCAHFASSIDCLDFLSRPVYEIVTESFRTKTEALRQHASNSSLLRCSHSFAAGLSAMIAQEAQRWLAVV